MPNKTKKEDYTLDLIIGIIIAAIVLIISFSTIGYNYGLLIGGVRGVYRNNGIEWMCNKINGTMEDNGYCLADDLSNGISTEYKHYFDCSWGKFTVISNYNYNLANFDIRIPLMQCKRTCKELI